VRENKVLYSLTLHRLIITAQEQEIIESNTVQKIIDNATRKAVDDAVNSVLENNTFEHNKNRHISSYEELRRWFSTCMAILILMFSVVILIVVFVIPSGSDLSALRLEKTELEARVADFKSRGALIQLTTCGEKKRLCALIDPQQINSDGTVKQFYSENGNWIILKGY